VYGGSTQEDDEDEVASEGSYQVKVTGNLAICIAHILMHLLLFCLNLLSFAKCVYSLEMREVT
jgi:hypothetical protein